ncbi:MAG: hypothetical protein JWR19_279 [Pedosphaera sp.]|jgi:hypothetical protein|nr:hypothetical protein [Pedosphaera sp.]
MKTTTASYVDFNKFCRSGQNRDLLTNHDWQRNVQFLTAACEANQLRAGRATKPVRRR